MDTSIASMTFYTSAPNTRKLRRHRIEVRPMKEKKVGETTYHYGIWENGEYVEYLTKSEMQNRVRNTTWDRVNEDSLHLRPA